MYPGRAHILALLPLFLVESTLESPLSTTPPSSPADPGLISSNIPSSNGFIRPNPEISYFWHQKGKDLLPLWPLESPRPTTIKDGGRDRVILIHRISDDIDNGVRRRIDDPNGITTGFTSGRDTPDKYHDETSNNIFVFCLMFLFGLIICGLIWCLCTVSRHQVDNGDNYGPRRMTSRFSHRRRADIEVILPYSTDLPPSYDDIVTDYEKLGSQCILPSYKDIMTRKASGEDSHRPTTSPPPRYTSPPGSFSAPGSSGPDVGSPGSPTGS